MDAPPANFSGSVALHRWVCWLGSALCAALIFAAWQKWTPFDLTEALGFVTGAVCVYLTVWENVWNFPIGIANNVFFFILFFRARIYGDAWLQVVYLLLAVHGWYQWLFAGPNRTELRVSRASPALLGGLTAFVILGTAGMSQYLRSINDALPVLDAFTTVLSLAAQYLLNGKRIENWFLWMAADVIYLYVYGERHLYLTAALYFVFLCLCVAGWLRWRAALRPANAEALPTPA